MRISGRSDFITLAPLCTIWVLGVLAGCTPAVNSDDPVADDRDNAGPAKSTKPAGAGGSGGTGGRENATGGAPARDTAAGENATAARDGGQRASATQADAMSTEPPGPVGDLRWEPMTRTFTDSVEVKLTPADPAAKIHYTLDDTIPTAASPVYDKPLRLTGSTTIRVLLVSPMAAAPAIFNQSFMKVDKDVAAFTSNLPIVLLHTQLRRPDTKLDWVRASTVTIFEPDAATKRATLIGTPMLNVRAGVRVRGSSTATLPKKSYKVELWKGGPDNDGGDFPVLGMPADSDWVMWAPYQYDRTGIRNPLVYAMSTKINRWAPRTRFVEAFFTDQNRTVTMADYVGFYVVIESIKRGKNRLNIAKLEPKDVADPVVDGGYIFRIDRLNTGRPGIPDEQGFRAGAGPGNVFASAILCSTKNEFDACGLRLPLAYDYPDERVMQPAQKTFLTSTIDKMADSIAARSDYSAQIDESSFIDQNAIQTFTKNPDGFRLSGFFHKDRAGKVLAGPAWDFDMTMGCASDDRPWNPEWWDTRYEDAARVVDATRFFRYAWYDGLFKYPNFKQNYFKRWRELVDGPWSVASLHKMIDDFAAEIGTEVPLRDYARWGTTAAALKNVRPRKDESDVAYIGTHADEVAILKRWVKARVEWVDQCLKTSAQQGSDPMACKGQWKTWPPDGKR